MNEINLERIRASYPITKKAVYMNHAAISPCPQYVKEAIYKHVENWETMNPEFMSLVPYGGEGAGQGETSAVKQSFAKLLNAKPQEIALVPNTNIGLNTVIHALDIPPGKNVVMADAAIEHPTLLPRVLANKGIKTEFVARKNGQIKPEDVQSKINKNTKLVFLGHVEYSQGTRNDIKTIGEIAHRHGAYVLVNAFQSVGAMQVDTKKLDVDFLSTGTYKWILGIKGTGFLYIKEELITKFEPGLFGWANGPYYDSWTKSGRGWIRDLHNSASRYETGSSCILGFEAARAAIDFLLNVGMDTVEKRILMLTDHLIDRLKELGIEIHSPLDSSSRSGIVTFGYPNATEVVKKLRAKGFWIAGGFHYLDGIRVSPHYYNTEEEIDNFVRELRG